MTNQTSYGFPEDRFGVYMTSQYSTAQYYADLAGGGRAGGPGIITITVPERRWQRFVLTHGIPVEVPVPTPPQPGQTETIIPFGAMPEFERFATYL
jgi:hypothetical protein